MRAQGRCRLTSGGVDAFNGHCTFRHKSAGIRNADVVKLDHAENPDATFDDPPQKASTSSLVGAALGALIGGLIGGLIGTPVSDLPSPVGVKGASAGAERTHKVCTYRGGDPIADSAFSCREQPRTAEVRVID